MDIVYQQVIIMVPRCGYGGLSKAKSGMEPPDIWLTAKFNLHYKKAPRTQTVTFCKLYLIL